MRKKTKQFYYVELLLSSSIGKLFSLLSKIALTSLLGVEVMSIYGLINPLIVLVIAISTFSLPNILSYLISSSRNKSKRYMQTASVLMFILTVILSVILYISSETIAIIFFHNKLVISSIKALAILVPFISLSSLIKGYFSGVREVNFVSSSQIFEEGSRLLFILFFAYFFISNDKGKNASIIVISLIIGEVFQSLYLLTFSNKTYKKNYKKMFKKDDSLTLSSYKEMISLALPMTLSRLIGSITYFLEPVILTTILLKLNYPIETITYEYGVLTTYVYPLLLLPGFFSLSLSNYLLPNLTHHINNNDYDSAYSIFKKVMLYCILIGLFFSFIFLFFGDKVLYLLYGKEIAKNEIKILAIPFLIYYLEAPLVAAMNAFGLIKATFITSLISSTIKIILLFVLIPLYKVNAVSIATISACIITVFTYIYYIRKSFLTYKKKTSIGVNLT